MPEPDIKVEHYYHQSIYVDHSEPLPRFTAILELQDTLNRILSFIEGVSWI